MLRPAATPKRRYTMRRRAASAAATRRRILDAAVELFVARGYDAVTLALVAEQAAVSLQTVLRKFGSKDALLMAASRSQRNEELAQRAVPAGDVGAVARVLADRYEATGATMMQFIALEERIAPVARVLRQARQAHRRWLAQMFERELPNPRDSLYARRLAQLFGATELYVWVSWRRRLGLSRAASERAMAETLHALVASWARGAPPRKRRDGHGC